MTDLERPPLINAPWPVLALVGSIIVAYAAQSAFVSPDVVDRFAVNGLAIADGRYGVLLTSLWLHGGWAHALQNAVFGLAFATPVARRMGPTVAGVSMFFIIYLVCGVFSGLVMALCLPNPADGAIGASGALAGMMGAASRLMTPGPGLAPFRSPTVLGMAGAWVVINLLFGQFLTGWAPGSGGAPIAWEAHLAGYAAGLVLIAPALRLLGRL